MNTDMLKTLSEIGFGLYAATTLAATAQVPGTGWEDMLQKLGALGLCAFMVLQNYRQQEALGRVVARKDAEVNELTKAFLKATQNHTDALNQISDALRSRPCIMGDARLGRHPKQNEGD